MKTFKQYINEGIRDKMTAKEGALDKLNSLIEELIVMLLEDKYFDTYEEAKTFLSDDDIINSLARMKGFQLDTDEIYVEISQFYVDEYLFNHNLPLRFAFDKRHKDDVSTMGSDAYNKSRKLFYYEDAETKELREQERRIDARVDEGIRDKMTPKSEEDIKIALSKLSVGEKLIRAKNNNALHLLSDKEIKQGIKELLKYKPYFIFLELKYKYEELSKYATDEEIKDGLEKAMMNITIFMNGYKGEIKSKFPEIYLYLYKHGYSYSNRDSIGNLWFKHHTKGPYSGGHSSVNGYSSLEDTIEYVERMEKLNEGIRDKMTPKSKEEVLKSLNANPDREFKTSKISGSGFLIGTFYTTYDNLVELFGRPKELDEDYDEEAAETLFYWDVISDDGHILGIYDRHSGFTKEELMNKEYGWHIRGRIEQDAKDLSYFIYKNTLV